MLLCIDIGNSTVGIGLFTEQAGSTKLFVKKFPSYPAKSVEKLKKTITDFIKTQIHAVRPTRGITAIVSSVVPLLNRPVLKALNDICGEKPLVVSHRLSGGLVFDMPHPEEVGADRIANAIAGFHRFKKPVAIVDLGTATTITVVGRKQNLIGGAILPGLELMLKSLHAGTAKLPAVKPLKPGMALGKNTFSSIVSGISYGTAGAIELLINNMEKELGYKLNLVLTGGHASILAPLINRRHIIAPNLTFEGLRLIHLNIKNKPA